MFDESTGGRHRSRGRSKSPVPGSGTKYSSAADVGATALAVEERTGNLNRQEMLSNWRKERAHMTKVEDQLEKLVEHHKEMKQLRKSAKRSGETFTDENKYQNLKKKIQRVHEDKVVTENEVDALAKRLGIKTKEEYNLDSSSSESEASKAEEDN